MDDLINGNMPTTLPSPKEPPLFAGKQCVRVRALFLGERIDLRALETGNRLAVMPLTITAGDHGCAVLFRYGVAALFDLSPLEEVSFRAHLEPFVSEVYGKVDTEEVQVCLDPSQPERYDQGVIYLRSFSVECLQLVADILAKSVVLSHYEASVAEVFDRIEPLAAHLERKGRGDRQGRELLRYIGGILLIQHKMVGRVEVQDKPEILWEHPELERMYLRFEDEYELHERHLALERKLDLIARTAETSLDLVQHNRTLRVEWYIVILIVVEILITLYEMLLRR